MKISRGSLFWADLNPARGSEIDDIRPCLVISNNTNNEFASTITVIPITSQVKKVYSFEVFIPKGLLPKDSKIKTSQIRTVDKVRLKEKIGILPEEIIKEVEKALMIHLGIY